MIEIRDILCPTDFSDLSRQALTHAIAIAKWYGSRITALNVRHVPVMQPPILGVGFADQRSAEVSTIREREERLRAWVEPARQAGIETHAHLYEGDTARAILDHAQSHAVDLIVMGTHGLSGFDRFVLGSVAEKVLRKATCPVLTVPPAADTVAAVPYTRLLCPVDFSESSLAALQFAFSLAKEADAQLTILHVFDWPPEDALLFERFDTQEFRRVVESQTRSRIDALVTDAVRQWCKPSTTVMYGKPYREILAVAGKERSDLIVMGVRGRNPLDLTLFGSTTNHVVRRAACPVLTLRA